MPKFAPMLSIQQFVFNDFQENTYLIWDETLNCAIVDPGCANSKEEIELKSFIQSKGLTPTHLLNTHCHIDHILGNMFVVNTYNLPLYMHEEELFTYADTDRWAAMFGLPKFEIPENKIFLKENDTLKIGNTTLNILFTPGHSIASISFYEPTSNTLLSGDVLFYESIGRTDLPGGSFPRLEQSIKNVLFNLPNQTKVFSGHGPATSIGHEKANNPYVGI